jgi:hypothetical protein
VVPRRGYHPFECAAQYKKKRVISKSEFSENSLFEMTLPFVTATERFTDVYGKVYDVMGQPWM